MNSPVTITDIGALLGVVFGTGGLVLGIMNYLRDRPRVRVRLSWDMSVTDNPVYDPLRKWGLVVVANTGRRPIFISHASIRLPRGYEHTHLLLREGLPGTRLAEGDPPVTYVVSQEGMEKYKKDWKKLKAIVIDSAGREYASGVDKTKRPSWAS